MDDEFFQHVGFKARPSTSHDLRGRALHSTLLDGETCIYVADKEGSGPTCVLFNSDGTVSVHACKGNAKP